MRTIEHRPYKNTLNFKFNLMLSDNTQTPQLPQNAVIVSGGF